MGDVRAALIAACEPGGVLARAPQLAKADKEAPSDPDRGGTSPGCEGR